MRYFGDGWQISKKLGGKHFWRIPVMDGEFVCEATTGLTKDAVGGGNLLLLAQTERQGAGGGRGGGRGHRQGARRDHAVSGRHRALGLEGRRQIQGHDGLDQRRLRPTLRGVVKSELGPDINAVLEIVIDGETSDAVAAAMRAGIKAVTDLGPAKGAITHQRRQLWRQARQVPLSSEGPAAVKALTFTLRRGSAGASRPVAADATGPGWAGQARHRADPDRPVEARVDRSATYSGQPAAMCRTSSSTAAAAASTAWRRA